MIHIDDIPITNYKNLELNEEVSGSFQLSFTSFSINNIAHDQLQEEKIVTVNDYNFRIKQIQESLYAKQITAVSTFFDISSHRKYDTYAGTRTIREYLEYLFDGTSVTFKVDSAIANQSVFIANFGDDNVLKLLQVLLVEADIEYQIMPNNSVHFAKQIGVDNQAQYRYGYNVKTLSRSVDTTNLKTQIKGYGANELEVTYTSPHAAQFGVIEAEPITDERYTIADNLVEHIKKQLNDTPDISLTLDTIELLDKELGETVWLIYEPLNIEFETRILSKQSIIRNRRLVTVSVEIGNALPFTSTDLLAQQKIEIDENKKEYRSKFEQTNEYIRLEVEQIDTSISRLEIQSDRISSTVSDLSSDVSNTQSMVVQMSGEISSKVSKGEVVSEINQTPERIKISAERIEMSGITELAGRVTIGGSSAGTSFGLSFGRTNLAWLQVERDVFVISTSLSYTQFPDPVQFDNWVTFSGRVDFSNATVIGLPTS